MPFNESSDLSPLSNPFWSATDTCRFDTSPQMRRLQTRAARVRSWFNQGQPGGFSSQFPSLSLFFVFVETERERERKRGEERGNISLWFSTPPLHHPSTSLSLHGSSVITSYFSIPPISPPFFVLRHRLSSIDRSPCRRTPRLCRACLQHDMCNIYVHGCIGATGVTTIDLSSLYARRIRYFFPFFFLPLLGCLGTVMHNARYSCARVSATSSATCLDFCSGAKVTDRELQLSVAIVVEGSSNWWKVEESRDRWSRYYWFRFMIQWWILNILRAISIVCDELNYGIVRRIIQRLWIIRVYYYLNFHFSDSIIA